MDISPLQHTAKLVCLETLFDQRLGDDDLSPSAEYMLKLLETDCFTAVSHKILERIIEYVPHKLTNRLLKALIVPHAREINVTDCRNLCLMGLVEVLKKCSHVQQLNMNGCGQLLTPELFTFCGLMQRPLTSVSVEGLAEVTDEVVQSILLNLPHLTALNVSGCPSITDDAFLVDVNKQRLRMVSCKTWGKVLCDFRPCLCSVDISGCMGVTSDVVHHITSLCGPHLQHLNIGWTPVDCSCLFHLAGYSSPTLIKFVLDLGESEVLCSERSLLRVAEVFGIRGTMSRNEDEASTQRKIAMPTSCHVSQSAGGSHSTHLTNQSDSRLHSIACLTNQSDDGLHPSAESTDQSGSGSTDQSQNGLHHRHDCQSSHSKDCLSCAENKRRRVEEQKPVDLSALLITEKGETGDKIPKTSSTHCCSPQSAISTADKETGLQGNTCRDDRCSCFPQHSLFGSETGNLDSALEFVSSSTVSGAQSEDKTNSNSNESLCNHCEKIKTDTNKNYLDYPNLPSCDNGANHSVENVENGFNTCRDSTSVDNDHSPLPQIRNSFSDSDLAVYVETKGIDDVAKCSGHMKMTREGDSGVAVGSSQSLSPHSESLINTGDVKYLGEQTGSPNIQEQTDSPNIQEQTGSPNIHEQTGSPNIQEQTGSPNTHEQTGSKDTGKLDLIDTNKDEIVQLYTPNLISLNITNIKFPAKSFGRLCLRKFFDVVKTLQKFETSWTELTEELTQELLPSLSHIQELSVQECTGIGTGGLAAIGRTCTDLRKINLRGVVFIKDVGMSSFYSLRGLTTISLSESEVTDVTLKRLARYCGDKLTDLDLSYCEEVTEAGVDAICKKCVNLRVLRLRKCPVSDFSLHLLADNCRQISELDIECTESIAKSEFSELGVLAVANGLRNLTIINICWNLCITDTSVSALLSNCPLLQEANLRGLKQITCTPFLPIISDMPRWKCCKGILVARKQQRGENETDASEEPQNSHDEELSVPHRSTVYAANLRRLDLEYSDLVEDELLTDVVWICRGSLTVHDYYGLELVATDADWDKYPSLDNNNR